MTYEELEPISGRVDDMIEQAKDALNSDLDGLDWIGASGEALRLRDLCRIRQIIFDAAEKE